MIEKVKKHIKANQLLSANDTVIVGVSGGVDSVALLHVLLELGYTCIVAHCNFNLRGEESNRDEKFVQNLAKNLNLSCHFTNFDTIEYAKNEGISIEMAARDLRYNWFEDVRKMHNAKRVAVAHHADDNVETLLMHLTRGTGIKGLTGIPVKNKNVVRPLLACTRNEIIEYLKVKKIDFVTDSSNAENTYTRNRFRNEIIPLLETINPAFKQRVSQSISIFNEIEQIYSESIQAKTKVIAKKTNSGFEIDLKKLNSEKFKKTWLFEFLHPFGFHTDTIEAIAETDNLVSGMQFQSSSHILLVDREKFILQQKTTSEDIEITINESDSYINFPIKLKFNTLNSNQIQNKKSNFANLDADKISFPLQLRKWRQGDAFYPFGMNKRKLISDFFIDQKINLFDKQNTWILTSGNKIVWIVGMRIDNRFAVTESTKNILEISYLSKTDTFLH